MGTAHLQDMRIVSPGKPVVFYAYKVIHTTKSTGKSMVLNRIECHTGPETFMKN